MWWFLGAAALQAFSQIRAGQAQAQEIEFERREILGNAARARADARLSERIGEAESVELALEAEQRAGTLRVQQGASGGRTDVGTNFLIRIQLAAKEEFELFKAGLISRRRTERFIDEALSLTTQAGVLKARAKNVKTSGLLGAATTILGGIGTVSLLRGFGGGGTSSAITTPEGKATVLRF